MKRQSILSLSIDVDDIPGILGKILSVVNEEKCSVLNYSPNGADLMQKLL